MARRCSGRSFRALGAATLNLRRALQTSGVSLGLADTISWLIARLCDDLAVPKLIEKGLICIMELYQCYLWLSESV